MNLFYIFTSVNFFITLFNPTQSQAHLQVAQADTRPKPAKELAFPTHGQTETTAKMKDRITKDKNGQLVTKAKIKRAESANMKGRAYNKLHRRLTVKCSEMPASF